MLGDEEWVRSADNVIANHVGVDHETVTALRGELEATWEISKLDALSGANGKTRRRPKSKAAGSKRCAFAGRL
jgi:hypothetical protein